MSICVCSYEMVFKRMNRHLSLLSRDCGALRVMMGSPVFQVSPVNQDLQDIHHTQE